MGIMGTLETMALADLFQWAKRTRKTGVLRVTRGKTNVLFYIKEGRVAGTTSNDPPSLLGQFLISRGKITEETLHEALNQQEMTRRSLTDILLEMGVVTAEELEKHCVEKAEETIFGMLEWTKALFDFDEGAKPGPRMVKMDHDAEDLLQQSAQRQDEMGHMRELLGDPGTVFCRTEQEFDPAITESTLAERIYQAVDGKRTFAQIFLHTRASEYHAMKCIFEMYRKGIIRIKDVQEVAPVTGSPQATCDLISRVLSRGDYELALDLVTNAVHERPDDTQLQQLLTKTESEYLEKIYSSDLPESAVPIAVTPRDELVEAGGLTPPELFMVDMIEAAKWDVKSLVRLSPMHELDVVRALVRLRAERRIELRTEASGDDDLPVGTTAEELKNLLTDTDGPTSVDDSLNQALGDDKLRPGNEGSIPDETTGQTVKG